MTIEQAVAEGVILGMGNPLLDISASVSEAVLTKYSLEPNNAILAEPAHIPLYKELAALSHVDYIAGGATQNSIRIAQWLLQAPGATSYFGAIGNDEYGERMTACVKSDGVNAQYFVSGKEKTGTCAVVITGKNRSLVADLAAANVYPIDHLNEEPQWTVVENAKVFYIAGFFLTVSPESILKVAKHALENNKTMCMNLSAPFLMQVPPFFAAMKDVFPYADIVFGNETEALTLAEAMAWDTKDIEQIAINLAQLDKKSIRPRTVIFTQGADPTIIVVADSARVWSIDTYPVIPIESHDIVDTNGAGDAFVGGYLAGLAKGVTIAKCVEHGNYASNLIIQQSGVSFPGKPTFSG